MTASPEGFPPQDLRRFLELCAGEWLALRSHFDLGLVEPGEAAELQATRAADNAADNSVGQGPGNSSQPSDSQGSDSQNSGTDDGLPDFAALLAQARAGVEEAPIEEAWHSSERAELLVAFLAPQQADQPGGLRVTPPGGSSRELHFRADGSFASSAEAAGEGLWQLWPDGSVELTIEAPGRVLRERIWFTQPNLRLRSSVEHGEDGVPGRARFSSEIRRVRKPAA
ncbi:MAG: phycobiliprotein lyase [Cyanobium sp.]